MVQLNLSSFGNTQLLTFFYWTNWLWEKSGKSSELAIQSLHTRKTDTRLNNREGLDDSNQPLILHQNWAFKKYFPVALKTAIYFYHFPFLVSSWNSRKKQWVPFVKFNQFGLKWLNLHWILIDNPIFGDQTAHRIQQQNDAIFSSQLSRFLDQSFVNYFSPVSTGSSSVNVRIPIKLNRAGLMSNKPDFEGEKKTLNLLVECEKLSLSLSLSLECEEILEIVKKYINKSVNWK